MDGILYVLHFAVLVFALTGWMSAQTRRAHRGLMATIGVFWLIIGPLVGQAGYCPLTALQWRVKAAMGAEELPLSWIDALAADLGMRLDARLVDVAATTVFVVLMALALFHWQIERRYKTA